MLLQNSKLPRELFYSYAKIINNTILMLPHYTTYDVQKQFVEIWLSDISEYSKLTLKENRNIHDFILFLLLNVHPI